MQGLSKFCQESFAVRWNDPTSLGGIVQVSNYIFIFVVPSLVRIMAVMLTFLSTTILHSYSISDYPLQAH